MLLRVMTGQLSMSQEVGMTGSHRETARQAKIRRIQALRRIARDSGASDAERDTAARLAAHISRTLTRIHLTDETRSR